MKATDIKPFKGFGANSFDTSLNYLARKIKQLQEEDGLQLNPDFQRGRVWSVKQQSDFIEFLLRGGRTTPVLLNHPGWLGSFEGEFVCVDGLQRLSSILDFLDDKIAIFGGHTYSQIGGVDRILRRVHLKIYINTLKTRAEVLEWYLELNAGGTPHTQEELDRVAELLETTLGFS
jgi:uncharacterized protein with ParB-like and HNH nuclease domain